MDSLHQFLNPTTMITLLTLVFVFSCLVRRSATVPNHGCKPGPPQATGAWPIFGHLPLLRRSHLLRKALGDMADTYGPIFTIRLGVHQAVVVSSSEIVKELFIDHDAAISSRPNLTVPKIAGYNAIFGFAPYGQYWRELRKLSTQELLSNRRLESLKHVLVSEIETSIKKLYKFWREKKSNSSDPVLIDLKEWFDELTMNVILRMVVGKRFFDGDKKDNERGFQKALKEFIRLAGMLVTRDAVPFLGWADFGGYEKATKFVARELDDFLVECLDEHKKKNTETQDFMDVMLSAFDGKSCGGFDADTVIKATCLSMMLGGSDTTTATLTWALSLLLNNPHELKKAQEELDIHVGRERHVSESDISNLVHLQATIKETMRLYPAAPLAPRQFDHDCTVGGYHVARGTRLFINIWKIHRDPQVWSSPLEFKPDRFLTGLKKIGVWSQNLEYIPFGFGRRACPGSYLGLETMNLGLAAILQAFHIWAPSTSPVDMTEMDGLANVKATPLQVLFCPRLSSHELYQ